MVIGELRPPWVRCANVGMGFIMCDQTEFAAIELPLDAQSARVAREFLGTCVCSEHGRTALEDATLLTSEVISNAVVYGGPPITLSVACSSEDTEVRVRDGNSTFPMRRQANELDTGGRGLFLVDALANEWGVETIGQDAKEVWFRVSNHPQR